MHYVVDSNYLTKPELREYLSKDLANFVVISDYIAMEAHKNFSALRYFRLMGILLEFPSQVEIARPTYECSILPGIKAGVRENLISPDRFTDYSLGLKLGMDGDREVLRQLRENSKIADRHLHAMLLEAQNLPDVFKALSTILSRDDMAELRDSGVYSQNTRFAVFFFWEKLTNLLFR